MKLRQGMSKITQSKTNKQVQNPSFLQWKLLPYEYVWAALAAVWIPSLVPVPWYILKKMHLTLLVSQLHCTASALLILNITVSCIWSSLPPHPLQSRAQSSPFLYSLKFSTFISVFAMTHFLDYASLFRKENTIFF